MNENVQRPAEGRNYGIDALRLFAMFMVSFLHMLSRGGVLNASGGNCYKVSWSLAVFTYCAVNCYGVISGFVLYSDRERPFKYKRYISLWMQVWTYSIVLYAFAYVAKPWLVRDVALKSVLFPVSAGFYWYFSAYTGLFFLIPWLNRFVRERSREEMNRFMLTIFLVFSAYAFLSGFFIGVDIFKLGKGYSFIWLVFLYLTGAWMKKCGIVERIKSRYAVLAILLCGGATFAASLLKDAIKWKLMYYINPAMLIMAVAYVVIFARLKVGKTAVKIIKCFAPASFGVYLLQVHPAVWNVLHNRFKWIAGYPAWMLPILVFVCAAGIFIIGLLLEKCRLLVFSFCKIDCTAEKILEWILKKCGLVKSKQKVSE